MTMLGVPTAPKVDLEMLPEVTARYCLARDRVCDDSPRQCSTRGDGFQDFAIVTVERIQSAV